MEEIANLLWIIVASKASFAHAGAIVENQGLDLFTHFVGKGFVIVGGELFTIILSALRRWEQSITFLCPTKLEHDNTNSSFCSFMAPQGPKGLHLYLCLS